MEQMTDWVSRYGASLIPTPDDGSGRQDRPGPGIPQIALGSMLGVGMVKLLFGDDDPDDECC